MLWAEKNYFPRTSIETLVLMRRILKKISRLGKMEYIHSALVITYCLGGKNINTLYNQHILSDSIKDFILSDRNFIFKQLMTFSVIPIKLLVPFLKDQFWGLFFFLSCINEIIRILTSGLSLETRKLMLEFFSDELP